MFTKSAAYYDLIYAFKDYAAEASIIHEIIHTRRRRVGNALLDVACGTGKHLVQLKHYYLVEGIDLDEGGVLNIARRRLPDVPFHVGDMVDFDLGRQYDIVTCLFSSIGYARTLPRMRRAIAAMARHTAAGGVLIVEPWFAPGEFISGRVTGRFVDEPDLKIARMCVGEVEGTVSIMDFHYMVATPAGIGSFTERHELGLFTKDQYLAAFKDAGMHVEHDPKGLGRGLYIATTP
jgi:ubiquinone/menaquinone biosynthesis C-methylase UbiE